MCSPSIASRSASLMSSSSSASSLTHSASSMDSDCNANEIANEEQCCYICLQSEGRLERPCHCPRLVHRSCLARWQLQSAGRSEERFCRFCSINLPDWKDTLNLPTPNTSNSQPDAVCPVMVVTLGDTIHRIKVKPGVEGQAEFQQRIRSLFNIPTGTEFEVTFRCKAPTAQGRVPTDVIQLEGMSSYEAAAHCASLMAHQRLAKQTLPLAH